MAREHPDYRNIIEQLNTYGITPMVCDPLADADEVRNAYHLQLTRFDELRDLDCLILAVAHEAYRKLSINELDALFAQLPANEKVVIDIKSILKRDALEEAGFRYWRL